MPKRSNLRLTTHFVKALRTDGKDAFFWDHELAGFRPRLHLLKENGGPRTKAARPRAAAGGETAGGRQAGSSASSALGRWKAAIQPLRGLIPQGS